MSKDAILGAIRRGLRRGPLPADQAAMLAGRLERHPRHLIPARSRVSRPDQIALFVANLEKEFASVTRVADARDVPGAVADHLAAKNLPTRFVMAPHPELADLPWSDRPMLEFEARRAEATDQVSVQHGYAAVAETGTILFPADAGRPATLNLLVETEIVVLRASRVVGAYEEAFDLMRAERQDPLTGGFMPRNLMLVTGPSRSADIESVLELGAHGPRAVHVVLIDDDPAALAAPATDPRPAAARTPVAEPGGPAAPGD